MYEVLSFPSAVDRLIAGHRGSAPSRYFAYVSDPTAIATAAVLFDQKRAIDQYALSQPLLIERYVVDSGMVSDAACFGFNLYSLFIAARRGEVDGVVVGHVSRFASDYALALRIAAAFSMQGVAVHEARGGLVAVEAEIATTLVGDAFEISGPAAMHADTSALEICTDA